MPLHFELVTPARLVRSEEVHMVEVPGSEGEFGVLEGHAPFMTTVRDGSISDHGLTVLAEHVTE
jgi:F-type H+-transporting ATPase subunit epsilon